MEEQGINIKIPANIEIEKYVYSFKGQLVNDFFSFRCKYRTRRLLLIKVAKDELIKNTKDPNYKI